MTLTGHELSITTGAQAQKLVRALGSHRYVLASCHEVHAFAVDAALATQPLDRPEVSEAARALATWAAAVLTNEDIDKTSRDPRLVRRVTDAELALVLTPFWNLGETSENARIRLAAHLAPFEQTIAAPFSEDAEEGMFPILVDAGWELLPLRELDEERHRGVIESFGERIAFESARFIEEDAVPPHVYLIELPAIGEGELTELVDEDGDLTEPFVVWTSAPDPYIDYLLRGVERAANK